ncbi:MAG: hypothetical protein FJY29_05505 [Betaproteobacteria bacterium]|nr:hypothetical protein [Betaproteobacteria bacterium]
MNPLVLPLNIGKDDTFRLTWKSKLYQAKAALVLPRKLTSKIDVDEVIEAALLVVKLTEFGGTLRAKMLSALAPNDSSQNNPTDVYGVVMRLNIRTGRVVEFDDLRRTKSEKGAEHADFMSASSEVLPLDGDEKEILKKAFNSALTSPVLEALRQPFASFAPELSESWKEMKLSGIQPDKLVPFQMLFPNAQPIERFVEGERFVLDDLYCTNPSCSCSDVTCVVLKFDPASGQEVAWGGFRWSSDTDKLKVFPQFSSKFNASEWFKQFDHSSAIDLKLLLRSRQTFMRTEFIAARKAARG